MDVQDLLFSPDVSLALKTEVLSLCHEHSLNGYTRVLTPTATNDDVNGSQHVTDGGTDFTYRDVDEDDLASASTLGYYEYFSDDCGTYTGHYYHGSDRKFDAIVLDPPAYAVSNVV